VHNKLNIEQLKARVSKLFVANSHVYYCGLVHVPHVEK